jgi:hypothetical protein
MLLVTLIAALFFTTEAKPLPVDEAATQYFTNILGNFSEIQQNGHPDRGLQPVDPFMTPDFTLQFIEGSDNLTFTLSGGVLLGTSNNTISAVEALTDDNVKYEISYTINATSYYFSAPYTAQGEIDGEAITASGVVTLTADYNLRYDALIAVKQGETYVLNNMSDVEELLDPVLDITGLPEAGRRFTESFQDGLEHEIQRAYIAAEYALLSVDLSLNPQ